MFIRQIARDSMLYVVCIAPLLAAFAFRFGIPHAEALLCAKLNIPSLLSGYYLLFDLFLAMLTPYLFCFASSMVILTENDENIAGYLAVTPIEKKGYLISRFAFPAVISFVASMLLLTLFSLTSWTFPLLISVCFLSSLSCIGLSLLVVSLSNNRVEGMAVTKMSGIMMLGIFVPFFLFTKVQYLFAMLPSFWIAKLCIDGNFFFSIPALITSLLWIWGLFKKYDRKLR